MLDYAQIEKWLFENRKFVLAGLLGLLLLGVGLFFFRIGFFEGAKVEILEKDGQYLAEDSMAGGIVVEIAGNVQKPGVYTLPLSSRVEELLILAGGLSAQADRSWVEQNLNRASILQDGQKVYIPAKGEAQRTPGSPTGQVSGYFGTKININTASLSQLETLKGIGPARGQAIIDNRPYSSIDELMAKKVIPANVYEGIKEKITTY